MFVKDMQGSRPETIGVVFGGDGVRHAYLPKNTVLSVRFNLPRFEDMTMTNVLRFAALAVAMTSLMTAPAFAGGGSSKDDPTLTIYNESGVELYVKVVRQGQEQSFQDDVIERIEDAFDDNDPISFGDAFNDLGGLVLDDEEDTTLDDIEKGRYTILYADADLVDDVDLEDPFAPELIGQLFNSRSVNVRTDTSVTLGGFNAVQ